MEKMEVETVLVAALLAGNCMQDIRRREIFFLPTLLTGVAGICVHFAEGRASSIALSLLPGILLLLCSFATRGAIGGGDAVLTAAVGAWTGFPEITVTVILALALVPAAAWLFRAAGKRRKELPFVPFILAGWLLIRLFTIAA